MNDKEGKKESKSKGNYTPPEIILDKVAMDFAVIDLPGVARGTAVIGRDDLEGLDLQDGARVRLQREGRAETEALGLTIRANAKLRRRVVALHADDRAALGVLPTGVHDISPVAVPRLPLEQRVTIEDPETSAPGADAFRWFFYASSPPWSATRHSLSNVRSLQKEFAVKLRNVYSFFTIYANIDGFDPRRDSPLLASARPELDRWIGSEVALTVRDVTSALDVYDVFAATQRLTALVDALSNWWVRRSRTRFWRAGWDDDKRSAYDTLHSSLVTISKLMAPFVPYSAEAMWQNLVIRPGSSDGAVPESVHLADWPSADVDAIDQRLSTKVAMVRGLVSLGLQVRTQAKIRVRQPLRSALVITSAPHLIDPSAIRQLMEELNVVDRVHAYGVENASQYVEFRVKPNFRSLGQRGLGKEAQALKKSMAALSSSEAGLLASRVMAGATIALDGIELGRGDVEVEFLAKPGFAAAGDRTGVVLLDTELDDELRELGFVRELQNRVQTLRKEMGLEYTDRIRLGILGADRVRDIVQRRRQSLADEVLAVEVSTEALPTSAQTRDADIEGEPVRIGVARV